MTERNIQMWFEGNKKLYLDECPFSFRVSEDRVCTEDYDEFENKIVEKYSLNGKTEIGLFYIGFVTGEEIEKIKRKRSLLEKRLNPK